MPVNFFILEEKSDVSEESFALKKA